MRKINNFIAAPLFLVGFIVIAYFVNIVIPLEFNQYGIRPRVVEGLVGIPLVIFLHGGINHLLSNIVPLFILGMLLRSYGRAFFIKTTTSLVVCGGLLTWLISSAGIVIGASGLVFAYFSYLITKAIRDRTLLTILIAVVTAIIYGGLLFSLTAVKPGVSWAGHFSGFVSGIIIALYGPKRRR